MAITAKEFEAFEQQFVELVSEFQALSTSENRLREELRTETARAEAAEASRDAAERVCADARAGAMAATAGLTQTAKTLASIQDELVTVKMKLEYSDRQRAMFEEKCSEMMSKMNLLERELQQLRPLQSSFCTLQRQYTELHECVRNATEEAQSEVSRLENELRRVEKCASAGSELRERARLAAAAHARERRLSANELQHTVRELQSANEEIKRQKIMIFELESRLIATQKNITKKTENREFETLEEIRAALEAERTGTANLEKALAAALADNSTLSAILHNNDTNGDEEIIPSTEYNTSTNISLIDSFLAE